MEREFEYKEVLSKDKCLVCKKRFVKGDKFILCPIQKPMEDGFYINAIAIPIHTKCYYVEKKCSKIKTEKYINKLNLNNK